jgi:hypothetical protein
VQSFFLKPDQQAKEIWKKRREKEKQGSGFPRLAQRGEKALWNACALCASRAEQLARE